VQLLSTPTKKGWGYYTTSCKDQYGNQLWSSLTSIQQSQMTVNRCLLQIVKVRYIMSEKGNIDFYYYYYYFLFVALSKMSCIKKKNLFLIPLALVMRYYHWWGNGGRHGIEDTSFVNNRKYLFWRARGRQGNPIFLIYFLLNFLLFSDFISVTVLFPWYLFIYVSYLHLSLLFF
jgi:hypothetical protein